MKHELYSPVSKIMGGKFRTLTPFLFIFVHPTPAVGFGWLTRMTITIDCSDRELLSYHYIFCNLLLSLFYLIFDSNQLSMESHDLTLLLRLHNIHIHNHSQVEPIEIMLSTLSNYKMLWLHDRTSIAYDCTLCTRLASIHNRIRLSYLLTSLTSVVSCYHLLK